MADTPSPGPSEFSADQERAQRAGSGRVGYPMPINRDGADYNIRSGVASGRQLGTKPGKFDLTGPWKMDN